MPNMIADHLWKLLKTKTFDNHHRAVEDSRMNHIERLWDTGQRFLANGAYVAARRELEAAEALAWRQRDAGTLARIYLPLLEVRRQIRQNAVEGAIIVTGRHRLTHARRPELLDEFDHAGGTLVIYGVSPARAQDLAAQIRARSVRSGAFLEAIILLERGDSLRLVSAAAPHYSDGISARFIRDASDMIDPDGVAKGTERVPMPYCGIHRLGAMQTIGRESLLIAWEALALNWQSRHPFKPSGPSAQAAWEEVSWLRRTLEVDPACEPVAMRLITVAESIERRK
jgi:hypothetical protein